MKTPYLYIIVLSLIFSSFSCKDKKKESSETEDSKQEILKNWAENIIIPSYKAYQTEAQKLKQAAQKFETEANETQLKELKEQWFEAYKAFQKVLIFNFDISEKSYFVAMANTFPCNTENINKNIQLISEGKADDINLRPSFLSSRHTYQGFPALDYLLFADGHNLSYFQTAEGQSARQYMHMLSTTLKKSIDVLVNHWEASKSTYINDTDASVTGSYTSTINAFIRAYEKDIRALKVGYAAGAINAQSGKAAPEIIEAYYKGDISKELLSIALHSSRDFFNGKHFEKDSKGESLASTLKDLGKEDLVKEINEQYALIDAEIASIEKSLKELALTDQDKMKQLYKAIQVNVANYKTKMVIALNVQIGYQDTDGD